MNFYIETFGCKVNQYDSQEIAEYMEQSGFNRTEDSANADIIIINSCTVTAESDRKARSAVRSYKKKNIDCITVLSGCLPQSNPDLYADFPDADIITGNKANENIPNLVLSYIRNPVKSFLVPTHKTGDSYSGAGITRFDAHTRAFMKIQDGCDCFCSYCIIPYSRGRSRSRDLISIKKEMEALSAFGYKEISLVGINLSDYGKNMPYSLSDVVLLADDIVGIKRVRLGSLEPVFLTDNMLQSLKKSKKLCNHFHISLQSGSDKILKQMNRRYTSKEYLALCEKLRGSFPNCALTTDIIVGFPGESDEDFYSSISLAKKARFEKIHIFPYSRRDGTKAALEKKQISNAEKRRRCSVLLDVAEALRRDAFEAQIGKEYEVLLEGVSNGSFTGYTTNYFPVKIRGKNFKSGDVINVIINGADYEYLYGVSK
ncbi:MAG TPA: tRNA (N(6)-L-threonylcarbamoyladenosine(37)-C(2))-methylthiotransferase MtaB [Clostridia bacterium]|nr:tRNA (N(6)-L-threonylcarbamoyladenosine(37)-C(2))-methylthiotransferase MtaB [Clostridia bacterium]